MTHSPEPDELAILRARAYGRNADIHTDPQSLRRLQELEGDTKRTPPADPAVVTAPPQSLSEAMELFESIDLFEPAEPAEPAVQTTRPPRSARAIALAWISTVVAAGLLGAWIGWTAARHDPTVIATLTESRELDVPAEFSGPQFPDPVRYQDYLGVQVITYTMPESADFPSQNCIAVRLVAGEGRGGCSEGGFDAAATFIVEVDSPEPLRARHPVGTVIRLQQDGNRIEVRSSDG
ncbi:hypothetical protein [Microbacterium aurantiacum]|uniref:hypothetical protein n=1 Tax=Microbacterium aurantiacum TaxID=162393 RepID=UPI000C80A0C5|nr:hypothetical protein [Microbacterium aurantiacum]